MSEPKHGFEEIKGLMRQEQDAISAAAFERLEELAQAKERMIASLGGLSSRELSEIRALAQRNHRLLGAALKGVQAAQRRLTQIVEASKGFTTYDTAGRSRRIAARGSSVEKKA